jgi:riboflavin biosynthesis pyrimidine reductase
MKFCLSSLRSLTAPTKAIHNDHGVDDLATGNTPPRTNTLMVEGGGRLIEKILGTHETLATVTAIHE